jgi:predicted lipoprotein with Yx(FWY)xxD motif
MKRLLILGVAVAVAAAVVAIAAYSAGGNDNSSGDAAPAAGAATVSSREIDGEGAVLVDSAGRALYASDQEKAAGKVLCTDGCTSFWMPLTVAKGSPTEHSVSGELGVMRRPDGARQVTLDGKLLYSFTQDSPGKVTGDGFEDAFGGRTFTWHVVRADGNTSSSGSSGTTGGPYGY